MLLKLNFILFLFCRAFVLFFLFSAMHVNATCVDFYKSAGSYLTFKSAGIDRVAYLRWPRNFDVFSNKSVPLILDIHGSGGNGRHQMNMTGWGNAADRYGFLVVAPQGYVKSLDGYAWVTPRNQTSSNPDNSLKADVDDIQYLKDLIYLLSASGCVNNNKIYLSGFSGGARLASQYVCQATEKIAGLIAVAGLRAGVPIKVSESLFEPDINGCQPRQYFSILAYANLDDTVNPYAGGGASYWGYGTEKAILRWLQLLGCNAVASAELISAKQTDRTFGGCINGVQVRSIVGSFGGHVWPVMLTSDDPSKNASFTDLAVNYFNLQ